MIAKREEEIRSFRPERNYYGLSLLSGKVKWAWQEIKSGSFRTFSREHIDTVARKMDSGSLTVTSVEKSAKNVCPGL